MNSEIPQEDDSGLTAVEAFEWEDELLPVSEGFDMSPPPEDLMTPTEDVVALPYNLNDDLFQFTTPFSHAAVHHPTLSINIAHPPVFMQEGEESNYSHHRQYTALESGHSTHGPFSHRVPRFADYLYDKTHYCDSRDSDQHLAQGMKYYLPERPNQDLDLDEPVAEQEGNHEIATDNTTHDGSSNADSLTAEPARERDEPYAKLIWRCLSEAPDNTLVLRQIYDWFRKNTDKGRDPASKGWQNSIRHNLSMNKAFDKIDTPTGNGRKRGFIWRLNEKARRDGVESTTRFRNKQPNKRSSRTTQPRGYRQAAGARGGAMAKHAAAVRRSQRLRGGASPQTDHLGAGNADAMPSSDVEVTSYPSTSSQIPAAVHGQPRCGTTEAQSLSTLSTEYNIHEEPFSYEFALSAINSKPPSYEYHGHPMVFRSRERRQNRGEPQFYNNSDAARLSVPFHDFGLGAMNVRPSSHGELEEPYFQYRMF